MMPASGTRRQGSVYVCDDVDVNAAAEATADGAFYTPAELLRGGAFSRPPGTSRFLRRPS